MVDVTCEGSLREIRAEDGVLRFHDIGAGPPVVLLHGSGPGVTGWRNFRQNLPQLAQHFRCLVLELPGFGVSDPTDKHPMVAAPRAVKQLLSQLSMEGADVIGNSMGGVVALQLAIREPHLFRRIVTVGGVGKNLLSSFPAEGLNLLMDFTEEPSRDALVRWLQSMVWDTSLITEELIAERFAQATVPATLASARAMYGRSALRAQQAMADASEQPPYWAMLHKVRAKTLLTWGRDDRVSPLDMALLPMRSIPDVELHVLPNCGHWAMIEQREAWESVVISFLQRPAGAGDGTP